MSVTNSSSLEYTKTIASKLPYSSKAIPLVENQENTTEFLRHLLEDFVTVNGNAKGYASIPPKERLRKFFNVPPSRKEVHQDLQGGLENLKADKKLLTYVVRYVALWVEYSPIFLPDRTFLCFIAQFIMSNVRKQIKDNIPENKLTYTFLSDIRAFEDLCRNNDTPEGMDQLEAREKAVGAAERMFIQLVYQWSCLSSLSGTQGYSAEQVAGSVLEFMSSYVQTDYCNDLFLPSLFTIFAMEKINTKPASAPASAPTSAA